ncbi:ANTAR domain-containing protein [Kineosporia sp. J2-2]|uniref:ANTAR domain-containing protein n=1 Tax=Kineosporia corallincola TaxID=2835133 RepID=A0ABS5TEW3_9ACTN|nr:GAF and ANTAR domain-containing protein [Kineosporia corallincola]MBT0769620.1 ANTAR domain-containing protein [Kineosporia corallincola]
MPNNHTIADHQQPSVVLSEDTPTSGDPGQALGEALIMLRSAQETLFGQSAVAGEPLSPETMTRVAEDLVLAEEELTAQLAEVESAAQAQRQGRALTRRLLGSLPIAVLTTDREGAIVEANPAAEELLRVPMRALERHKPVFAFIDVADRRTARGALAAVKLRGEATIATITLTPREGEPVTCQVVVTHWPAERAGDREPVQWVLQPVAPDAASADELYRQMLVELSRLGVGDADLGTLLRRVAELATRATPGAQAASIVIGDPSDPATIVSTSPSAQAADGVQYMNAAGPVFDAFTSGEPVLTHDPLDDPRWPALHRAAGSGTGSGEGPGSWLALPLVLEERTAGVLVLYAAGQDFTEETAGQAAPFVAAAGTLVRDVRTMQEIRQVQEQLREALSSRAVIDQAKGMIMLTRQCSAEEAFAVLVKMSNDSNRKIRDLAAEFVDEAVKGRPPMH